jgi:diguanylate cyclase (GGDEF)-like protein
MRALVCWLALSAGARAQQYVFRGYGQAEGLKNLDVAELATDQHGFLWVATENGLYRFLGSSFERFGPEQGIAELNIHAVVLDPNGTVWAGTQENLYRWDGQRFVAAASSPIQVARWNSLAVEDPRHLLVVVNNRLYRLEHDEKGRTLSYLPVFSENVVASMPDLAHIATVTVVSDSLRGIEIWIGAGKKLYSWLDPNPIGHVEIRRREISEWGKEQGIEEDAWGSVLLDHTGTLWAGGLSHVAALPQHTLRFVDRGIPGSTQDNAYVHAPLVEDREGRVLAPAEDEVARWEGNNWRIVGRANGLRLKGHVVSVTFAADGDPWIATRGDGLYHWTGYEDWEGWNDVQHLPSAAIWTVIPSHDRRVFIGTDKGPGWIDPGSGLSGNLFASPNWAFGQVDTLGFNRDGSLWGGTFSGAVLRVDPRAGQATQTAKLPTFITRTVADTTGRVFYTGNDGIYVREAAEPRAAPRKVEAVNGFLPPGEKAIAGCLAPGGAVWFVTDHTLIRLQDGKWTQPAIDGLPRSHGFFLDISCAVNGAVWVTGQQSGTWRLRPNGNRIEAWQLELPPPMQALIPVAIVADRRGWVWLGTDGGLLVWNGQRWRHMTQESGLIWNDINQGSMLGAADGSLWIGTSGGVAHLLHPDHVFDPVPLNALVTSVLRGDATYSSSGEITLPWSTQPLQIKISSATVRNRSELAFSYRMEGLQTEWVESQSGRAVFAALPPGQYTFVAQARNPGLDDAASTVTLQLRVLPPWWRSNSFYALCGMLFLLLLLGVDKLHARHLKARSRELEAMVRERTLELEERTHELEVSREQLRTQAARDGLTGMLNHVAILQALSNEMERARRENKTVVLAMVDLDHFKSINDDFGHLAGDDALRKFAAAVALATRSYDHAGRYGGEEFLLILTEVPRNAAQRRLEILHSAISNLEVRLPGSSFQLTCSVGATVFDSDAPACDAEFLLAVADQALYAAKEAGRNRIVFRQAESSVTRLPERPTPPAQTV